MLFRSIGWFFYLPWGGGFIYYALNDLPGLYRYTGVTVGLFLIVVGLRKGTINRIKQAVKVQQLVEERKADMGIPNDTGEIARAYDD